MRTQSPPRQNPPRHAPSQPARRALLTGAGGFVGREVRRQLLESGWEVVAISRHLRPEEAGPGVIQVAADAAEEGWQRWCGGCSAAIHLVGIIREIPREGATFDRAHRLTPERVISVCREVGIKRLVHMSALGTRANAATAYHRTKWQGEEAVRGSGLAWTIFRPSLIFGPGDGFTSTLTRAVKRFPVFPVFGDGTYKMQPISVAEVAHCFVVALDDPAAVGQTYELGGPEALTYDEVLRRIAHALGLRRTLVHVPLGLARFMISVIQHFPGAPISRDQLTMLLEGSTCDVAATSLAFDVPHACFEGPTWLSRR